MNPVDFEQAVDAFPDAAALTALRDTVASRGQNDLDVGWCIHASPLGDLLLAFHGPALVRLAFENEGFDAVLDDLGHRIGPRTLRSAHPADALRHELDQYFSGTRTHFDVATDLRLSGAPFRRSVQETLPYITYGHTASYAELAALAGRPKAVRAVGTACATNPLPIVLPCHRVVRSDGSLGHYLGGTAAKNWLLTHEHAVAG